MSILHRLLLIVIPILSISLAILQPRISTFGIFRSPSPSLNVDATQCRAVDGLEACEDAWIDHELGLAYLYVISTSLSTRSLSPPR